MDFLDPKKKRAHLIRLYIGYGLMSVALAFATVILVFAAYGYDIDRQTGGIIQNGLVVVDAHPESATVYVNGENKGTTDTRLVLPANKYSIELRRDGYRSWKHDINLEGSSIEQLVYPFLYPEKPINKTLQTYNAAPPMASESPDRKWLVISLPQTPGSFQVVDLGNTRHPTTTITLPPDTFTPAEGAHTFEAVEWSTDNTHLLLKHAFTGGVEFLILNRDKPAESLNLNKVFAGQVFTTISLRDKKPDKFYLLNAADGLLSSADSRTRVVTPLKNNVKAYKSYEDTTLLYVSGVAGASTVEVRLTQKAQDHVLRTLPVSPTYMLDMARFNDHFYVASGASAEGRVYVYQDPYEDFSRKPARSPEPTRVLIVPNAEFVSFSAIARFIAVQGGSNFAVFDAETGRQFRYDTKLTLEPRQKATWMDGHRLVIASQGNVQVFDFDGTNRHQLTSTLNTTLPFFDRDYNAMFTLSPSATEAGKINLVRTELKVLPDPQ